MNRPAGQASAPARIRRAWRATRRAWRGRARDRGQLSVLIIGLFAIAALLVVGAVDTTAAHLARVRLVDAADAAALDAADAVDEHRAYQQGLGTSVAVSDASVRDAAAAYLAARPRPDGLSWWALAPGTGSPDGRSAIVVLTGRADLPLTGGLLEAIGRSVTITVEGRATARLRD